jgi:hypothetical protein
MTVAGGTNVTTSIVGNTLTIDASVLTDGITALGDGTLGNEIRVNLANPFIWTGLHTFNAGLNGTFGTFTGNVSANNGFFTTDVTAGGDVVATGNVYGTDGDFTGNLIVGGTSDLQGNVFNSTGLVTVNDGFVVTGASNLQGAVTANNGATITAGGLLVQAGGITVSAGGANITGGVGITGALTTSGLITAQAGINTNNNIYNSAADVVIDDNLDLTGNFTQSVDKATVLGYSTAGNLAALNASTGTVIAYTGAGPVALANLPAGVNGQVIWFVNASGGILVVDGINVGNNEMIGFVYAAGAWHRMP